MLQDERIRALTQDLYRFFQDRGALGIEPDVLQPAELLLDLYGEDIRARAYLASDPLRGEQMLRPDYTVPVVQTHMEGRANPARYTYAGKVFRKQEQDAKRASEIFRSDMNVSGMKILPRQMQKYLLRCLMRFLSSRRRSKRAT